MSLIAPFSSLPQVASLMDRVEEICTEHFTGGHRRQAMAALRPMQQPASHHVTYFLGTEITLSEHGGVFLHGTLMKPVY